MFRDDEAFLDLNQNVYPVYYFYYDKRKKFGIHFPYLVVTLSFSSENLRFISIWLVIVFLPNSEIFHDLEPDNQGQYKSYL